MGIKENYAEITDSIVRALEEAVREGKSLPWVKPWASCGAFRNAFTGRPYSGLNTILLGLLPFKDPRFATYKAIAANGGQVRKGEKGTKVIFWSFIEDKKDPSGKKRIPLLRVYTVFNVEQAEGLSLPPLTSGHGDARREDVEAAIKATGAVIREGSEAFYMPSVDEVTLPAFGAFKSASHYYATAFHELAHWTGEKTRLDRDLKGRFGSDSYAFEELVAELASTFLCRDFSVDAYQKREANSVAYIASWVKRLKEDDHAIFRASSLAEQAARFIKKASQKEEEQEQKEEQEA